MERVTVTTPLGPVVLEHRGNQVAAKGDDIPLSWWQLKVDGVLFGAQGHIFYPKDCDLCDVLAAAASVVGPDNVTASASARAQAAAQLRTTPEGAIP
jgi:hypothetical protein